jgi:hypothetical protein
MLVSALYLGKKKKKKAMTGGGERIGASYEGPALFVCSSKDMSH